MNAQSELIVHLPNGSLVRPMILSTQDKVSLVSFVERVVYLVTGRKSIRLDAKLGRVWTDKGQPFGGLS